MKKRLILYDKDGTVSEIFEFEHGYIKNGKFNSQTQFAMNKLLDHMYLCQIKGINGDLVFHPRIIDRDKQVTINIYNGLRTLSLNEALVEGKIRTIQVIRRLIPEFSLREAKEFVEKNFF